MLFLITRPLLDLFPTTQSKIQLKAAFPELNAELFLFLVTFWMCVWTPQLDPAQVTRVGAY